MKPKTRRPETKKLGLLWTFAILALAQHLAFLGQAGQVTWQRHAFSLPESIWSIEAVDANADGQLDIVALGVTKVFGVVAPDWKQHVLADGQDPKFLYCVAIDADLDGDSDIAIARYRVPWIEYREALKAGKKVEEPRGPDFSLAWIENTRQVGEAWPVHVLDRELNGIHGLSVGDVNGDGARDVIADSIMGPSFPRSLVWFQTPRDTGRKAAFQRHVITKDGADGRPHYLDFADVNGDGRGDVLLGDSGGGTFTWWEQGASPDQPWTKHQIAEEKGATNIRAARVNRDGTLDIVGGNGHGRGVFWLEGPSWKKYPIDLDLATPHALACGDFDSDGDMDVAAASFTAFVVCWYENDGDGNFVKHEIDTGNRQQAYDMKVADLNSDGRLDLLLAGRESNNAVWYRNQR